MAPGSSRRAAQEARHFGQGTIESAAAGVDELASGIAHAVHFLGILEEMDPLDAGVFGIVHLNGGASLEETSSDGGEVLHGVAENGDFAKSGRLQNIVATGRDKRATNKNAVGNLVEGGEFTNAVEEEDGDIVGDFRSGAVARNARAGNSKIGATNEFAMRLVDKFGGGGESLGLTRGEDEEGLGKISLNDAKGDERQGLFGGNDAAGNNDGPTAAALGFFGQPGRERRGRRKLHIVFKIAADFDAIRRRAKRANAFGVFGGLHEESGGVRECRSEEGLEIEAEEAEIMLIAREGTVGNAAAEEKNGDIAALGFAEEVGPNLGFENDDDGRINGEENFANRENPIKRKINNGIGKGNALLRQSVRGEGGGGNDERAVRIELVKALG